MIEFNWQEYLTEKTAIKTTPKDFHKLMDRLGNPQDDYRVIHVAGTNGKGSTCAFVSNILQENDFSVGMFTSPALRKVNERMQIDNVLIEDREIKLLAAQVEQAEKELGKSFAGFHRMTAMALVWFSRHKVDFAVIEAGIGGEKDCTNICDSEISMITAIGMDHMSTLGSTIEEIAEQKAAIIKEGQRAVIVHPQTDQVMKIIEKRAQQVGVPIRKVDDCGRQLIAIDDFVQNAEIVFKDGAHVHQVIQMMGVHQIDNACAALLLARELRLDLVRSSQGIEKTIWPGRMELLEGVPPVLLDGAHNPSAMKVLVQGIRDFFPDHYIILIMSAMSDKDNLEMVNVLSDVTDYAIAVPLNERSIDPNMLIHWFQAKNIPAMYSKSFQNGFVDALRLVDAHPDKEPLVVVTGSLYLVGEFRAFLLGPNEEYI